VSAKPPASPHHIGGTENARPSTAGLVHRVACDGCGWIGYRRNPWARDCPSCGVDKSKLRPVWLAGLAPRRGHCCYLGHLWPAYGHAQHYVGFTTNLPVRWPAHLAGGYNPETHKATGKGARLLAAALYAGCTVELVRVWYGQQARSLEQRLKQRRKPDSGSLRAGAKTSLKPLCPVCNPSRALRRYPDLPDPPPPRPGRFVHDPKVWDADREWDLAFPHLAHDTPAPTQPVTPPTPADQERTMSNHHPAEDEIFRQLTGLPRSLSVYWAQDRDVTGELLQQQEILAEQALLLLAEQQDHDRQEAFARLNPDFGVLPDSRHPDQHRFAQQRERALALGERVAAAEQSGPERGEPSNIVSFPRLPATPPAAAERTTDRRQGVRQRLQQGYQRRQTTREQPPSARASRSTPTRARTSPAEQERER
jgi:hypothetical protein